MKRALIRTVRILLASFLLLFVKFLPVHSSHLQGLSLKELSQGADSILVGKVLETYSDWGDQGRYIYTYVKFKILNDIKGTQNHDDEVLIRYLGGVVGNKEMSVEGGVRFRTGEKALLFLEKSHGGFLSVMGLSLGKFRIIYDAFSAQEVVENPSNPQLHVYGDSSLERSLQAGASGSGMFLDSFVEKIKENLE